ncbi:2-aminoadipate aminotransferase [Rhodoferax koreense]|uniref:2-aminoadipate aminotransferase n=1 Tax=Rhodoferax koreensis TaxID=1842727 RepID=A0A1P8K343_9BURK|nr:PLP-dependent aminotransferase family protein [Rhodoferax koreense]APW40407.1 2-aminoadipate aminotransferase [Rhodoferax koreense]
MAALPPPISPTSPPSPASPLYQRLASHYRQAIHAGVLAPGERMPSVRKLTLLHQVSLSTALEVCHRLEDEGLLAAKPRSGYFVQQPRRARLVPLREPEIGTALEDAPGPLDRTHYRGIHQKVSDYVAQCERASLVTNLAGAYGAPEAYPAQALHRAATRVLRQKPELLVSAVNAQGDVNLRTVLARRALGAGMRFTAEDIVVTYGCTEALNIALRAVTSPGDTVAVESPTYYGLLQIIESLGLRALEIPTSPATGLSIEALELAFRTHPAIKAVVAIPNLHNPLGCVMPDDHKARLVALCEGAGIPLIEDDTYGALADGDTQLQTAKAWDQTGNVIYCCSLRKTLAPGLRLGWVAGGRWHARIQMLKYAQSRYNEALAQMTAAEYMQTSAYDRHILRLRQQLKTQREQMAEAIATYFPAGTRLNLPQGSMMLWVELPDHRPVQPVFSAALKLGIRVAPGTLFSNSARYDHFMRICCGDPHSKAVDAALRQLAGLLAVKTRSR